MAQLTRMHAADKSNKALIFTQYNDTIRYLGDKLRAAGFAYRTISGSMPMKQRAAAIEAFQRDPPTTVRRRSPRGPRSVACADVPARDAVCLQVFILSVRSGAVGINLTSANFIFMMEPLMNPALDEQAVGRAWRMGQKRPVTVKRLIMRGTLEDSISTLAKGRKVCRLSPVACGEALCMRHEGRPAGVERSATCAGRAARAAQQQARQQPGGRAARGQGQPQVRRDEHPLRGAHHPCRGARAV